MRFLKWKFRSSLGDNRAALVAKRCRICEQSEYFKEVKMSYRPRRRWMEYLNLSIFEAAVSFFSPPNFASNCRRSDTSGFDENSSLGDQWTDRAAYERIEKRRRSGKWRRSRC